MRKRLRSGSLEPGYRIIEVNSRIFYVYPSGVIYRLGRQGEMHKIIGSLSKGYNLISVTTTTGTNKVPRHRMVAQAWLDDWDHTLEIDHINRIRNDNRVENLRVATRTQNSRNNNSKGYRWNEYQKCWIAYIEVRGVLKSCRFSTEKGAKKWRLAKEQELFGEFAPDREENNASS